MIARFLKNALLAGIPFGMAMGLVYVVADGWKGGAILGCAAGILFGVIIAIIIEVLYRTKSAKDGIFEGEPVLHEGPANHFKGAESRGGWLTLTLTRLAFRSHGFNVQNQPVDLPLAQLESVDTGRSLGLIPNKLLVRIDSGETQSFALNGRKAWVLRIREELKKVGTG